MAGDYIVRYGSMRFVVECSSRGPQTFARHDEVIVRTRRGTEWGEILCPATERTREYLGVSESAGKIIRSVTIDDEKALAELRQRERSVFDGGRESIAEHKLQMQLVDVEVLFGNEKIIFYYLSEERVDFRELVKSLAKRFHTRIEMRQIGVRDEAKLLADYGDCGKPTCCNTYLSEMPPVSMKMAKVQKASLDPTKISGRCGRLKCCLRYEYDTYEEYRRELPGVGKWIVTREGKGKVLAQEILARKVLVSYEDNRRVLVDERDVMTVVSGGAPNTKKDTE